MHSETLQVSVVVNGKCDRFGVDNVGTTPAALYSYLAVKHCEPDLIINAGTAGGFKAKGAGIGDVFLSTHLAHHDRRIPIPGFTAYGIGSHDSHEAPNLALHLRAKTGVVTTSNSLDHTEEDDKHMLANDAAVKDMEGAAIAWVAEQTKTAMIAVKVVTDIVDGERATEEEFMENLGTAAKSLQDVLPKVVEFVAGKKLDEL
jgi:5'-methylthioadenosine nucleosidase